MRLIVQFAKARNISLVFFTPPGYSTYVQNLEKDKLNDAIHEAVSVAGTYENSIYLDWLNDNSFVAGDYYDADHLNEIGAKKLSLKMDRTIDSLSTIKLSNK